MGQFAGLPDGDVVLGGKRDGRLAEQTQADVQRIRRLGRLPAVTTGTARRDGTARHVVQLRALPAWRWEQELAAFEARCYLPAPDRPTVVHGVAELLVEPDALGPSLSRLADRLALFEASITA